MALRASSWSGTRERGACFQASGAGFPGGLVRRGAGRAATRPRSARRRRMGRQPGKRSCRSLTRRGRRPGGGPAGPGPWVPGVSAGEGPRLRAPGRPRFPGGPGDPGAAGDEVAQGLAQGILVVVRQPAEQGHQFRAEAGDGVQHRFDAAQAHRRGLRDRRQEIAGHHLAAHRDLAPGCPPGRRRPAPGAGDRSGSGPGAGPPRLPRDRKPLEMRFMLGGRDDGGIRIKGEK